MATRVKNKLGITTKRQINILHFGKTARMAGVVADDLNCKLGIAGTYSRIGLSFSS